MRSQVSGLRVVPLVLTGICLSAVLVGCGGDASGTFGSAAEQYSERPAAAPTAEETPSAPAGEWVMAFEVGNGLPIRAGGTAPTFKLDKPATLVDLMTYHYVGGGGPTPGTLALEGADGTIYGPWPCTGIDAQGGVKNGFWDTRPNAPLPAGTYTIVDSGPATWSTNDEAGGVGFCTVQVVYDE